MDFDVKASHILKISALTLSCATLIGCGTIQKPTSSYSLQRFATPEIASEAWRGSAHVGYAQMHKVVLPDSANSKPNFDCKGTPLCVEKDPYFLSGGLSVMPGLAFDYNSQLNRISTTWQFDGEYQNNAKAGNISQALVLGYSSHSESDSTDVNIQLELPGDFQLQSWDQTTKTIDIGWVGGYRIDDKWLVYGGPFVAFHDVDNSVSINRKSNTGLTKIDNQYNFSGRQLGANIALKYQVFYWLDLNLEFVSAQYRMNNYSTNDSQLNFMLGSRF